MTERGVNVDPRVAGTAERAAAEGRTTVYLAVDGRVATVLVFRDELRQGAAETIDALRSDGVRCVLVTGDRAEAAEAVGGALHIPEVHAGVLPHEKVALVRRFQAEGHRVAFVGDGVNDGPALAAADVGIAMGISGTDLAIETAEVVLLSDELRSLTHLSALSRRALTTIRWNLVFSVGVLVLAVVLTVIGVLTPVTGALVHELSSIPVIANSIRLIGYRR